MDEWIIRPFSCKDAIAWKQLLKASNNATLFHDLDFLAYHSPGRYDFCHLVALRRNRIDAVIPGALSADGVFCSPTGAAVGGPAVRGALPSEHCIHLVDGLQSYAKSTGWHGIDITLPPSVYHREPDQTIEFALHATGFQLVHRSMPLLIRLDRDNGDHYQRQFRQSQRSYVRACRRKGVVTRESGVEGLSGFLELFAETYSRLQTSPTHTPEEIESLLIRLPANVRIWSAYLGETIIASTLVLILNRFICNTFYICDRVAYRDFHGSTVLLADAADVLAQRGFRYIDLGPSASSAHFNQGVVRFKESLGARGFCRDRWQWNNCAAIR
jgi:hypothetical protein